MRITYSFFVLLLASCSFGKPFPMPEEEWDKSGVTRDIKLRDIADCFESVKRQRANNQYVGNAYDLNAACMIEKGYKYKDGVNGWYTCKDSPDRLVCKK